MTDKEALEIMQEFRSEDIDDWQDPVWSPNQVKAFDITLELAAKYVSLEE